MRIESLLLAAACAAVSPAHAVGLSITPASPTPADTLVLEVTGAPPDDYSGHYTTDAHAEGVTVFQQGKTAFISLMYYGADGQPRWAVMPDARWGLDEQGGLRFFGPIWRVEKEPASPGEGTLSSQGIIGMGSFYPSGILGRALLKTQQPGIPEMPERLLTRLRF